MILDYSKKCNKIILETEEFQLLFKLGEYYEDAIINQIQYLKNGVIQFVVNKNGMVFEDYLSIIDTLCKEQPNYIKDEELEERIFKENHDNWEFNVCSSMSLDDAKLAIIRFIRKLREDT
ncbi:hypothetical protein [Clostridium sp.]|uniref:hypothetical protein n=1 Tax=Clostridium sp. TaxID=1506 RepID=UPI003216991E